MALLTFMKCTQKGVTGALRGGGVKQIMLMNNIKKKFSLSPLFRDVA